MSLEWQKINALLKSNLHIEYNRYKNSMEFSHINRQVNPQIHMEVLCSQINLEQEDWNSILKSYTHGFQIVLQTIPK